MFREAFFWPGGEWIESDEVDEDDGGQRDVGGHEEAEEECDDDVRGVRHAERERDHAQAR